MLIENRTTWTADHIRAIVEAAVKATGYDKPIERVVLRRGGYMRAWFHSGCLTLRLAPADCTPLEMLALGRQMSGKRYRSFLAELVKLLAPLDYDKSVSYDDRHRNRNNIIRRALGLVDAAADAYIHNPLLPDEAETFEIPAWADLPLTAGERGKSRAGERVETLRAQLLAKEKGRARMIEEHVRLLSITDTEVENAKAKLAVAEAKLNAPKKPRQKKSDVTLALTG
jgi:hypothetical protein